MSKNKKMILGVVIVLIIVAVVVAVVLINNNKNNKIEEAEEKEGVSKLISLKEKLEKTKNYSINLILNDENSKVISRKDEQAKVEINDEGEKKSYLVKDDTTYLLVDKTKRYYEYKNTSSLLNDFINNINDLEILNYEIGTENIKGKDYKYEEFQDVNSFLINYKGNIDSVDSKTRLYFDGSDLKYIKTYVGDVEQLLKVEITFNNQNNNNFDIPKEYSK